MSDLNATPQAARLQIAIFGRRNAGKSSLINALTRQAAALVSPCPGTTTDPVFKTMELLPLGPVVFIDTAGLDDGGALGALRVEKSYQILNRADLALVVVDGEHGLTRLEIELCQKIREAKIPLVGVVNKSDLPDYQHEAIVGWRRELDLQLLEVSTKSGIGLEELKQALVQAAPNPDQEAFLVGDLVQPGNFVVLVVPIDKAAPKGRLILPQQQVIRDILEHDAMAIVTKEFELRATLDHLGVKPALVITDSQVFAKVAADTPEDIPLTSFSMLMARYKGNFDQLLQGIQVLPRLKPGDNILIVEACTHHRQADDIATVKIPRWLRQQVGGALNFQWVSGMEMPKDIDKYQLVVHCGACMLNRRQMAQRLVLAQTQNVPMVNYGILIAYVQGVFPRGIQLFPEAQPFLTEVFYQNPY